MRFSMLGLIQYLTRSEMPAPRWISVTRAPVQYSSSAAMAAEFLAPTTSDVVIVVRMRLLVIVDDLVQIFAGDVQQVGHVVVAGGEHDLARAVFGLAGGDVKVAVVAVDATARARTDGC